MKTAHSGISYRADIQGLRAVAIALVVLAHAQVPWLSGGFVGVDVFFVLSGYLITGLLIRERNATGELRYVRFLARRLKRLLPALLVMLTVVLVAAALLLSSYETRMQSGSFVFSATWTSNLFFAFVDRDYFSALPSEDLFLHTWSLGIEEQFYIVWPWLISLTLLFVANRTGLSRRNVLISVFAGVFTASLLLCIYWSKTQALLSFYMMPSRGWQFALGSMVFMWFDATGNGRQPGTRHKSTGKSVSPAGIVGCGLIVGSALLLKPDLVYPGYLALFPSVGAAMVIAAGAAPSNSMSRILAHRKLVWLGDRSYSLYLWHWPVLVLGGSFGVANSPIGIASLLGISLLLAVLSFRLVELPFWKGRFSNAAPGHVVLVAMLSMLAVSGVAEVLQRSVYGISTETFAADGNDPRNDAPAAVYAAGRNCDTGHFNAYLIPCAIGARDGKSLAVLIGDSIGAQWSSLVTGVFSAPDWEVIVLTKSSCAIVDEDYFYDKVGADYKVCTEWRNAAIDYIGEIRPDVVLIGSSAQYDFSESEWVGGTRRVLARLTAAAGKVVVIPGTPTLTFDGPSCLTQPYRFSLRLSDSTRECEEAQHAVTNIEVANYLDRAAADFDGVSVLDFGDLVCPGQRCSASTQGGMAVFRDNQHLTNSFVEALIPEARQRLAAMGVIRVPGSASAHAVTTEQEH